MNITIAKNAGFCYGVKKAVDEVEALLDKNIQVYSIGEIIHNEYVIEKLQKKGLIILNDNEATEIHNKNVLIRSHGIEKDIYLILKNNGNTIYDLTCPNVSKIHSIVEKETKNGTSLIIIGDKEHPEVKGIKSYANGKVYIIDNEEEIANILEPKDTNFILVSQTTQNTKKFKNIVDILNKIFYNIKVYNTICLSTENRQNEANEMSKISDAILVVGSKKSSNTKKLYDICMNNTDTYFVESINDLENITLNDKNKVGIVAGASTPNELIEEIVSYAKSNF